MSESYRKDHEHEQNKINARQSSITCEYLSKAVQRAIRNLSTISLSVDWKKTCECHLVIEGFMDATNPATDCALFLVSWNESIPQIIAFFYKKTNQTKKFRLKMLVLSETKY